MIWVESPDDGSAAAHERISVAPSTRVVRPDDDPGDFETGARVVFGPFEGIALHDLCALRDLDDLGPGPGDSGAHPWNTIAVIQTPAEIVEALRDAGADMDARADMTNGHRADGKASLEKGVARWLQSLADNGGWLVEGVSTVAGFSCGPRPRSHTTVNSSTGRRVGLHLDSWDKLPPRERWRGNNRICLNLGMAPRGFMFVPALASGFADELLAVGVDIDRDSDAMRDSFGVSSLARRYLEAFSDRKVIRVMVWPGEAYIAPTENLIHDGNAPPGAEVDLSLTIRGNFAPIQGRNKRAAVRELLVAGRKSLSLQPGHG